MVIQVDAFSRVLSSPASDFCCFVVFFLCSRRKGMHACNKAGVRYAENGLCIKEKGNAPSNGQHVIVFISVL